MKFIIVATLLLALMAPQPAKAQSTNPKATQAATLRKARLKVWTGITLVAAGAALLPITDVRRRASSENVAMSSMALIGGGTGLLYWGFKQKRQATQPSTAFGVTLGQRSSSVLVRRSW
jgi:hypothetical protein